MRSATPCRFNSTLVCTWKSLIEVLQPLANVFIFVGNVRSCKDGNIGASCATKVMIQVHSHARSRSLQACKSCTSFLKLESCLCRGTFKNPYHHAQVCARVCGGRFPNARGSASAFICHGTGSNQAPDGDPQVLDLQVRVCEGMHFVRFADRHWLILTPSNVSTSMQKIRSIAEQTEKQLRCQPTCTLCVSPSQTGLPSL